MTKNSKNLQLTIRKTEAEVSCKVLTQYIGKSVGISTDAETLTAADASVSFSSSLFTVILTNTEKVLGNKEGSGGPSDFDPRLLLPAVFIEVIATATNEKASLTHSPSSALHSALELAFTLLQRPLFLSENTLERNGGISQIFCFHANPNNNPDTKEFCF